MPASGREKIGLISVLAFAVGAMIGGGVFTLSGTAINRAGPAALLSYAIAGVIMLLSALSSVALATRAKQDESGFAPVTERLGRPWRFLVIWGFYLNALLMVAFRSLSSTPVPASAPTFAPNRQEQLDVLRDAQT